MVQGRQTCQNENRKYIELFTLTITLLDHPNRNVWFFYDMIGTTSNS